jgi:hypothetical protein
MIHMRSAQGVVIGAFVLIAIGSMGVRSAEKEKARPMFEEDVIKTETGDLKITFLGHGTLLFEYQGKVLHVDPVGSKEVDYSKMPRADLILITHEHGDHLDPKALKLVELLKDSKTIQVRIRKMR